jgi:hypothetical protein
MIFQLKFFFNKYSTKILQAFLAPSILAKEPAGHTLLDFAVLTTLEDLCDSRSYAITYTSHILHTS